MDHQLMLVFVSSPLPSPDLCSSIGGLQAAGADTRSYIMTNYIPTLMCVHLMCTAFLPGRMKGVFIRVCVCVTGYICISMCAVSVQVNTRCMYLFVSWMCLYA